MHLRLFQWNIQRTEESENVYLWGMRRMPGAWECRLSQSPQVRRFCEDYYLILKIYEDITVYFFIYLCSTSNSDLNYLYPKNWCSRRFCSVHSGANLLYPRGLVLRLRKQGHKGHNVLVRRRATSPILLQGKRPAQETLTYGDPLVDIVANLRQLGPQSLSIEDRSPSLILTVWGGRCNKVILPYYINQRCSGFWGGRFLSVPSGSRDLNSPTRDCTLAPSGGSSES